MANNTYVLDLQVTGADLVTVIDDGDGTDSITVKGIYDQPVEINLSYAMIAGVSVRAGAMYFDRNNAPHRLIVSGQIENVRGSNGRDQIAGNGLANKLFGDADIIGPGGEDTLWGGPGNDSIHGGVGSDQIDGEDDDDQLWGEVGNDTIHGGDGADTVEGGRGADMLFGGGDAGDTLRYATSHGAVRVALKYGALQIGFGGDAEGDNFTGFRNVIGSRFADRIADADKASLDANVNDNALYGGGGADRIFAGGGNDSLYGGAGRDRLLGEVGDDVLVGGAKGDFLAGGAGQDTLTGGGGPDHFIFRATSDSTVEAAGRDTITDFSSAGHDRIDLRGIDAATHTIGNQAFHLILGGFTGTEGELRTEGQGRNMLVMGDVDGDGVADFAVLVLNVASLGNADFML